ncbi:succinate dehydrogenase assembly factor 2 [Roseovarius sp. 2305UL8-3]|uniref:FAD assembly factor SdhE n=1 Tax=Roseovarius conchicola TaxID=3121636 RepID=UPI00352967DB
MSETRATRLKRLHMRSMRRGIKEMDIILSRFAEARLETLSEDDLALYEVLLEENDQDLYQWVTGQERAPDQLQPLIDKIAALTAKGG